MSENEKGVALAGGGPLGAIYETGALVALDEALQGFDLNGCDVHVGVSSGAFLAAGLANGLSAQAIHRMLMGDDETDEAFVLDALLKPALGEYGARLATLPSLLAAMIHRYVKQPFGRDFMETVEEFGRSLPTGIFDNSSINGYLAKLFSKAGRTNDFRNLAHKLFIVATDLDSGAVAPFGAPGWDTVPISRAVQASSALPGLYPPVEIDGRWYVDGVLNKTLHASLALKEGVKLLLCVNPLVPFNADLARRGGLAKRIALVDGGLPRVLSQTFRAIIRSRMEITMTRYKKEYPGADILLFEPSADDTDMFFSNIFSYADRQRLSEHAYRYTRAELLRRYDELQPLLARHGVTLDRAVLTDDGRTLMRAGNRRPTKPRSPALKSVTGELDRTLEQLEAMVKDGENRRGGRPSQR